MKNHPEVKYAAFFLFGRLTLLATMSLDGLRGFGDLTHFHRIASMGVPFVHLWVEFPPVFPFLSWLVYQAAGGREHIYDYLMVFLLSLAQAASLIVFYRIAKRTVPTRPGYIFAIYFVILLVLPYGWWYFDSLAVLFTLTSLWLLIEKQALSGGLIIAAGVLTKLFPALMLPAAWRYLTVRKALQITLVSLGVSVLVMGALYVVSPRMTRASLASQASKGSWETIWALVDGNLTTGNFGAEIERYDPQAALVSSKNPARIPTWVTLVVFGALGMGLFFKAKISTGRGVVAFTAVTWCIFSLWSPGYSPQWVLYLLPLILLVLPQRQAGLFVIILVLINILEWPVMLSRGYNWGLWITIPLRTLIWVLLAATLWPYVNLKDVPPSGASEDDWITAG